MSANIICHILIWQTFFEGSYMHCAIGWQINIFYFQAILVKISHYIPAQCRHCLADKKNNGLAYMVAEVSEM